MNDCRRREKTNLTWHREPQYSKGDDSAGKGTWCKIKNLSSIPWPHRVQELTPGSCLTDLNTARPGTQQ